MADDAEELARCVVRSWGRLRETAETFPENTAVALMLLLCHVSQFAGDDPPMGLASLRVINDALINNRK